MKLKLLLIGLMVMLLPPVWGGGLQGVGNGQGYDPNAARNDASSIVAATWRTVMSLYSKDESWYTGNPIFADNAASMTLPVNGAALSIAVADGQCGFINADVEGKWATGTTFVHVNLSAAYENFGNTLALIGSPASTTNALNAATYSASISVTDNVIKVIGSGDVGAEWVVKKLEVK